MKSVEELKPNFGPVYAAALYPGLAAIFHRHGYALACHGSVARDFDLIAVPWTENVSTQSIVIQEVTSVFALTLVGETVQKLHGRTAYTLSCGFGQCSIDLSFMPVATELEKLRHRVLELEGLKLMGRDRWDENQWTARVLMPKGAVPDIFFQKTLGEVMPDKKFVQS